MNNLSKKTVDLESLVGLHKLSGVDFGKIEPEEEEWQDTSSTMTFVLDGETYTAVEDPSDGYRSALEHLLKGGDAVKNTFEPVKVFGMMRNACRDRSGKAEVLSFYDAVTAKLVLELGTDDSDDYYPSCILFFDPRGMVINAGKE